MPVISVVIPVYNVEKYLRRCVDSVTGQTFRDMEILLVDDGSTDSSGSLCEELARTDSRIRVFHKENGGASDARNYGIDRAQGEYLIFIDSDDFIDPDMLETLHGLTVQYGVKVSACTTVSHYREEEKRNYTGQVFLYSAQEAMEAVLLGKNISFSVCTKLMHRELCQNHRFCVGNCCEDTMYNPGLFHQVDRVAVLDRPMYHYWHRSDSITTAPFSERDMDVVEAHEYALEQIRVWWPELEEQGKFCCRWARFLVLDKMLACPDYRQFPQFEPVVSSLKGDWKQIARCPWFQRSRRIAAVALRLGVPCYRLLLLLRNRKQEVNA